MEEKQAPVVAIIGGGVIGGGWAARFLLHGWRVQVFDLNPDTERQLQEILVNARASLPALADVPMPSEGELVICNSIAEAVSDTTWIQESVPEELSLKRKIIAEIQEHAPSKAILGSSTSGFKPSELQQNAMSPEKIVVAHPFNPVYLLPLVEVVCGNAVNETTSSAACEILRSIGMKPLLVRREIDAHIADRFLEAVWREALWLINDDIATTEEIDDAIKYGFGLRWAQMGLFENYRLAGGEAGMAHFIEQFGPALQWPWTKLMDVPDLTDELVQKIASQSDAQANGQSLRELERIRDRNLVGMMRSLKDRNWAAGEVLHQHDRYLAENLQESSLPAIEPGKPALMLEGTVLPAWIDYNGHMTDFRYTEVFSESSIRLLRMIGADSKYLAQGSSYYTAESHIIHVDEVGVNEPFFTTAQVLHADAKRLHVFFSMHASGDKRVLATAEEMYLHVDTAKSRVSEAQGDVLKKALDFAEAHADIPRPTSAGRYVGQKK